jgi:hypothetical protein
MEDAPPRMPLAVAAMPCPCPYEPALGGVPRLSSIAHQLLLTLSCKVSPMMKIASWPPVSAIPLVLLMVHILDMVDLGMFSRALASHSLSICLIFGVLTPLITAFWACVPPSANCKPGQPPTTRAPWLTLTEGDSFRPQSRRSGSSDDQ